jgi:hypothetical protein
MPAPPSTAFSIKLVSLLNFFCRSATSFCIATASAVNTVISVVAFSVVE